MTTRRPNLFPGFTTSYLKALGELLICANRLQRSIESTEPVSDTWRARADELVGEALHVADAIATAKGGEVVRVTLPDGTSVIADLDYLDGLARKMHRHHSLRVLHAAIAGAEMIAS